MYINIYSKTFAIILFKYFCLVLLFNVFFFFLLDSIFKNIIFFV